MSGFFLAPPVLVPFMEIPTALIALGYLGFEVAGGIHSVACNRKKQIVDHVLVSKSGLQIGVRLDAEGRLELLVDEDELRTREGLELQDFEKQVQQKYQYAELLERLKSEGYTVVEENEESDQTIRLVVRRWR